MEQQFFFRLTERQNTTVTSLVDELDHHAVTFFDVVAVQRPRIVPHLLGSLTLVLEEEDTEAAFRWDFELFVEVFF